MNRTISVLKNNKIYEKSPTDRRMVKNLNYKSFTKENENIGKI
jgi:hypothetical protein